MRQWIRNFPLILQGKSELLSRRILSSGNFMTLKLLFA